jgi:ADP-ribosylglycohydrolase
MRSLKRLIELEIEARRLEGCDTWAAEREFDLAFRAGAQPAEDVLLRLFDSLESVRPGRDWPYHAPAGLEEIHADRPEGPRTLAKGFTETELVDRIHGGWLGMAVGAVMGRPVTGWVRERIEDALARLGLEKLDSFWPAGLRPILGEQAPPDVAAHLAGGVSRAPRSERLDLALCSLEALEGEPGGLTAPGLGRFWTRLLPFGRLSGAPRMAYRNLVDGLEPPETATVHNPCREDAGAAVRGCIWGLVWPGRPENAARCAYEDARLSQAGNGVYLAMWTAAVVSAAFVAGEPRQALAIGASEIPKGSRLFEAVAAPEEAEATPVDVRSLPGEYAVSVGVRAAAALSETGEDFGESVGRAVLLGGATDACAIVTGAVLGVMRKASGLPDALTAPLRDRLDTALAGHGEVGIEAVAVRAARCAASRLKQQRLPW